MMDAYLSRLFRPDNWYRAQAAIDAANISEAEKDARYQALAYNRFTAEQYDHTKFQWSVAPPDAQCLTCYEWRRFPLGQRHFGWAWWRICSNRGDCPCEHHKTEVWIA